MVVENVDVRRSGIGPAEQDAPLAIDPDAVQTGQSALHSLQSIPGWGLEVIQCVGIVEHVEFPACDWGYRGPAGAAGLDAVRKETLDGAIGKSLNRHGLTSVYLMQVCAAWRLGVGVTGLGVPALDRAVQEAASDLARGHRPGRST